VTIIRDYPDWAVLPLSEAKKLIGDPSRSKVYELIRAGDLEAVSTGARTHIRVASLRAYIDRMKPFKPPTPVA